jgi:transcription termination/antitermination protein NusG
MSEENEQLETSAAPAEIDNSTGSETAETPAPQPEDKASDDVTTDADIVEAVAEVADDGDDEVATDLDDDAPNEDEPLVTPGMNWFVLRVASNKEDSVRETLLKKVKIEGFTNLVNRILVPTEKQKTIKGGKTKITLKKLYPGYVFVEMKLEADGRIPQDVFFLIKETTGVGDFIGTAGHPTPMPLHEVEKILEASKAPDEQEATVDMKFKKGDKVKIQEGPFENMEGEVDALLPDQGKVRVIVTIFGRAAPLEVEHWLIDHVEE